MDAFKQMIVGMSDVLFTTISATASQGLSLHARFPAAIAYRTTCCSCEQVREDARILFDIILRNATLSVIEIV